MRTDRRKNSQQEAAWHLAVPESLTFLTLLETHVTPCFSRILAGDFPRFFFNSVWIIYKFKRGAEEQCGGGCRHRRSDPSQVWEVRWLHLKHRWRPKLGWCCQPDDGTSKSTDEIASTATTAPNYKLVRANLTQLECQQCHNAFTHFPEKP